MAFLRGNAYDYYRDTDASRKGEVEDKLYSALFHSLEPEMLADVTNQLLIDHSCPRRLFYKAEKILSIKVFQSGDDVAIDSLLALYNDRASKRVSYAAKEIKRRYPEETHEVQCRILRAFLLGGKKELEWAGRRLRDHWVEALAPLVCERWEATHDSILAYAVLRHMPTEYVLRQQEALESVVEYAYVCARLGNETGFEIDDARLKLPQYFYAIARSEKYVNPGILITKLRKWNGKEEMTRDECGLLLWALGKLGLTDEVMRLLGEARERELRWD